MTPIAESPRVRFSISAIAAAFAACSPAFAQVTAPHFPVALAGVTSRLSFEVATPLSAGSVEEQTRSALGELRARAANGRILKLRVFAKSADLSQVEQVIAGEYAAGGSPLPVMSLLGVAGFPVAGRAVVMESTVERDDTNPNRHGLVFLAGLAAPTGARTMAGLLAVARAAGVDSADVMRVSCFAENPDESANLGAIVRETFPSAQVSVVLSYLHEGHRLIECEGVACARSEGSARVRYVNLPGGQPSPYYSQAAIVTSPTLVFTGGLAALGDGEAEVRAPLESARGAVESLGASLSEVVMGDNYWMTPAAQARIRALRPEYFRGTVPAATGVFFEGLSSEKAVMVIELVVAGK